jgi:hypothetical protein
LKKFTKFVAGATLLKERPELHYTRQERLDRDKTSAYRAHM